jgi:hypothetical protein
MASLHDARERRDVPENNRKPLTACITTERRINCMTEAIIIAIVALLGL